ncbi:MAG: hypothetical protein Q9195_003174 [Heterodermia aff. obscurata]
MTSQCSQEVARAEQKPHSAEPTFQEREQARRKETDAKRSTKAKEHALRKKDHAAKQEAAARREAERLDMKLQKRLVDQYGYGRHCSPSAAVDSPDIELTPIKLAKEIEVIPEEEGSRSLAATMSLMAPVEYESEPLISSDEGRNPSSPEISEAEIFKGKGKWIDKREHGSPLSCKKILERTVYYYRLSSLATEKLWRVKGYSVQWLQEEFRFLFDPAF